MSDGPLENLLDPRKRRASLLDPWEEEEARQQEFSELDRVAGIAPNISTDDEGEEADE